MDDLVKTARHEKQGQLVHELHSRVVSFDSRTTEAQVAKPLVSLKEAVDHAVTGNYEIDFELHGGGEVVELAKSVQNLTSLLRREQ